MAATPHLSPDARWVPDARGEGRGVVVSARPEAGLVTISVWRGNVCVATIRLAPDQAADVVAAMADGLARLDARPELSPEAGPSSSARPAPRRAAPA
ncbi:hypothetical protein [Georgenia alba]|uniref:Uncharacterized protein n=1 Tax=Georgenia alba TaxID=2233858 RepID=A0ABW2QDE0_9MICO